MTTIVSYTAGCAADMAASCLRRCWRSSMGAIKTALDTPDLQKRMDDAGQSIRYMDPSRYAAFWAEQEPTVKELLELADQQPSS